MRVETHIQREKSVDSSRADIITFLDSDDAFFPFRLRDKLAVFESHPDHELLISSFITVRGTRQTLCANRHGYIDGSTFEKALAMQVIFIAGPAVTVRRDSLLAIRAFDPAVPRMQDREMLLRLAQRCGALMSQEIDWTRQILMIRSHIGPTAILMPTRCCLANSGISGKSIQEQYAISWQADWFTLWQKAISPKRCPAFAPIVCSRL